MKNTSFPLLLALLTVSFGSAHKNNYIESKVNEIASNYLRTPENAGIAIALVSGGEERIYCYGNQYKNVKVNSNSIFEIGSISKVFTALVLAKEVEIGSMNLNDNVFTFLPRILSDSLPLQISLLSLATHSSGMPRLADNFWEKATNKNNPYSNYTKENLYEFLRNYKIDTRNIGKYYYSNVGVGLLGLALCIRNNTSYEELINKIVCNPMGLKNTCTALCDEQKAHLALGHSKGKEVENWDFLDATAGQGALRSDIKDMLRFMRFNLYTDSTSLQKAIELTQTSHFKDPLTGLQVGLGWHIGKFYTEKYLEHTGGTGGYRSFIGLIPGTKTGVVVLSNSDNPVSEIGLEILFFLTQKDKPENLDL